MKQSSILNTLVITTFIVIPTCEEVLGTQVQSEKITIEQSKHDISAAHDKAQREGRELHILLGAEPQEEHIAKLLQAEAEREAKEASENHQHPYKRPIRIFFNRGYHEWKQISNAETPILNADFNDYKNWEILKEVLGVKTTADEVFKGPIDKIYFDIGTAYFAKWGTILADHLFSILKPSGELFTPESNLVTQATFGGDGVPCAEYQNTRLTQGPLKISYLKSSKEIFNQGLFYLGFGQMASVVGGGYSHSGGEKPVIREIPKYCFNHLPLVNDRSYGTQGRMLDHSLNFQVVNNRDGYPEIGLIFRPEMEGYLKEYIKVTRGDKR